VQRRLVLLITLGIAAGTALAWWSVAANTLFLLDWGAEQMPWVYVGVALFVPLVSIGLITLQRRWSTARVVITLVLVLAGCTLVGRLGLLTPQARWFSPVLMITFTWGYQMLYAVVGLLSGQLLDIRQIKQYFAWISAGVNVGITLGSAAVPLVLAGLGGAENLLLATAVSLGVVLLVLMTIIRRYRAGLVHPPLEAGGPPPRPLGALLRQPYVLAILGNQMLASTSVMLVSFIFLRVAESYFREGDALANFFGGFGAVTNILSILAGVIVAGWLLGRFGLGVGLTLNAVCLGLLLGGIVGIGWLLGATSTPFFLLTVGSMAIAQVFNDTVTYAAIKTSCQILPAQDQQQVEMAVEGIGVPVSYGVTSLLVLLLTALPRVTLTHLLLFTLLLLIPWLALGIFLYRGYAANLVRTLSRRVLQAVELTLADSSSLAVITRLLHSGKLGEVRLALDTLVAAGHPTLPDELVALLAHADPAVRVEALHCIGQVRALTALPHVATTLADDPEPSVRGAAVQTFCALREADAVEPITPLLAATEPAVRLGASVGLLRHGGIAGILAAGQGLTALARDPDPCQRAFVAQVIGQVGVDTFYQPLLALLADESPTVRLAALDAAQHVRHSQLIPLLIQNLETSILRSAALAALTASGDLVLPFVARVLADQTVASPETTRRLVRVCGQIRTPQAVALLQQHLDHPQGETQHQVLQALHFCGYRADAADQPRINEALNGCICHGLRLLLAQQEIGDGGGSALLSRALCEELQGVCQRLFLLLSFCYDPRALSRAGEQLAHGSSNARALALETLDVTLSPEQKALVLPLVDKNLTLAQRISALNRHFALPTLEPTGRLAEIIAVPAAWPQGWTRACAIYAAGHLQVRELAPAIKAAGVAGEHPVPETAAWALARLKPDVVINAIAAPAAEPTLAR
jgi:ATP:ADP antiporter, AAA family